MDRLWHILRVASGAEKRTAIRVGVPAYVPHRVHMTFHRKHRRVVRRFLPALPGLVFVRVPEPREINVTLPNVKGWMRDGTRSYITLSEQDFKDMRHLELNEWLQDERPQKEEPVPFYVGDEVMFTDSSVFAGKGAIIERLSRNRAFFRLLETGIGVEANLSDVKQAA